MHRDLQGRTHLTLGAVNRTENTVAQVDTPSDISIPTVRVGRAGKWAIPIQLESGPKIGTFATGWQRRNRMVRPYGTTVSRCTHHWELSWERKGTGIALRWEARA